MSLFAALPPVPMPGQLLKMERAGTYLQVGPRLGEGSQGIVHVAALPNGARFALKWYKPAAATADQWHTLMGLVRRGNPHPAFLWPLDLVTSAEHTGFGYLMPLRDPRFVSFGAILRRPQQPSFRVTTVLGRELVDAFAALHGTGLCYRDISFNNIFADPEAGEICVVDNDNIGTDTAPTGVGGTLRFMAPEILRGEALPSASSDLHSLAVLLFFLFVHGHPLDGRRVESTFVWDGDVHQSDSTLALIHYGKDPLFVFHPTDDANRPVDDDPMWQWWSVYPPFLRELFTVAFTDGLVNPSPQVRVTGARWRAALNRLRDDLGTCAGCGAAVFYDRASPDIPCWRCGSVPPPPLVLQVDTSVLVMTEGAELTSHHLCHDRDFRTLLGVVEALEAGEGQEAQLALRNLSNRTWDVWPDGEDQRSVAPGQRLGVRPMTIDFGATTGRITVG